MHACQADVDPNYIAWVEHLSRAWIAQSVEHQTFNLRVQGSSPCSGVSMQARKCRCDDVAATSQPDKTQNDVKWHSKH